MGGEVKVKNKKSINSNIASTRPLEIDNVFRLALLVVAYCQITIQIGQQLHLNVPRMSNNTSDHWQTISVEKEGMRKFRHDH